MTPENFVYWLQGMLEIGNPSLLDSEQIQIIKDHILLVLKKETPIRKNTDVIPSVQFPERWINSSRKTEVCCGLGDIVGHSLQPKQVSESLLRYSDVAGSC